MIENVDVLGVRTKTSTKYEKPSVTETFSTHDQIIESTSLREIFLRLSQSHIKQII